MTLQQSAVKLHTILGRQEMDLFFLMYENQSLEHMRLKGIIGLKKVVIWQWAQKRWPKTFSQTDYEWRDKFSEEYYNTEEKLRYELIFGLKDRMEVWLSGYSARLESESS